MMKHTDIKIDLAFITTIYLGYLYLSGRIFIDGAIYKTGNETTNIGFDFTDYVYEGFLINLGIPQYIILAVCIIYFIARLKVNKKEYEISYLLLCEFLNNPSGFSKNDFKGTRNRVLRKYILDSRRKKKVGLFHSFHNNLLISYLLMITLLISLMLFFLRLSDFSVQGQEASLSRVLSSSVYILKDKEKMYQLACGKDKCIYANKIFSNFIAIKEDEKKTYILEEIPSFSSKYKTTAFILSSKKNKKTQEVIVQINMHSRKEPIPYKYDVKLTTSTDHHNQKIYSDQPNDFSDKLNSIQFVKEKSIPYFAYFKIPSDENITSISIESLPEIYD